MFVCVRHMTAFMSCVALGLCFRQGNNYLYTVSGFVARVSGDHFVAYVRSQNQWLLCNDATVSVVSVLGPVGPLSDCFGEITLAAVCAACAPSLLRAATASVACRGCCRKLSRLWLMLLWCVRWKRHLALRLRGLLARALDVLRRHCNASVVETLALPQVSLDGNVMLIISWN